jgi:hypothetical protein
MHAELRMTLYTCMAVLTIAVQVYAQPQYTVTDLDIRNNPYFDSLSNDGIVAGSIWVTAADAPAPALSNHGQVDTLPIQGNAYARNHVGQTVGDAFGTGRNPTAPLEWTAQGFTRWPLPEFTVSGSAVAINDTGMAVCTFTLHFPPNNDERQRVSRCHAGGFTILPDLGGGAFPWGINLSGYISGVSGSTAGRLDTMAIWTPQDQLITYGLGTLYRINDAGQFAGITGEGMAVGGDLQSGPIALPLPSGFVRSAAYDINADGVRVGRATLPSQPPTPPPVSHAIRWDADGSTHDLNGAIDPTLGWLLTEAVSINDHGEILARATHPSLAGIRSVLLTPGDTSPSLAIRLNQTAFQPGQTLHVTLDLSNPGPMLTTDVYTLVLLPDGDNAVFLTNLSPTEGVIRSLSRDNPRTFPRLLAGVSWPAGLDVTQQDYWVYTRTGFEANGTYHLVVAWTKPNSLQDGSIDEKDILALDWKAFQFTGPASTLAAKVQEIRARHATE